MTFGQKVKELRENQGLSQTELAGKMNISQQAIAKYEKMTDAPKMSTIKKLANALDCNFYSLIDGGFGALDPILPSNMQGVNLDGAEISKPLLYSLIENLSKLSESDPAYRRARNNLLALADNSDLGEYARKALKRIEEEKISSDNSERILEPFGRLNEAGQNKAIEQVEMLTRVPEYRADIEISEESFYRIDNKGNIIPVKKSDVTK